MYPAEDIVVSTLAYKCPKLFAQTHTELDDFDEALAQEIHTSTVGLWLGVGIWAFCKKAFSAWIINFEVPGCYNPVCLAILVFCATLFKTAREFDPKNPSY